MLMRMGAPVFRCKSSSLSMVARASSIAIRFPLAVALALVSAAAAPADIVLAESPEVVLTRADWEADLLRIPSDKRDAFASSPQRVQASLNTLLVNKTLAARARAGALGQDPLLARRIALEADRILAAQMLDKVESDARAEFDRNPERNLARAREYFLANGGKYVQPEQIDASQILISTDKRDADAALAIAVELRAKLAAGAEFGALAVEFSDEPMAKNSRGRTNWISRGAMEPAFERAAFALQNPGDLSAPVRTRLGYHVIRLEGRKPSRQSSFDEAKMQIIDEMRAKYIGDARDAVIAGIRSDARLKVNQEAVDALVVKFDYSLPAAATPNTGAPAATSTVIK